jgi:hypothetical protein
LAIADALGRATPASEEKTTPPSREKYEALRARFSLAEMPLRPAPAKEAQWQEFLVLRAQYEAALLFVACHTFTPLDGILRMYEVLEPTPLAAIAVHPNAQE